MREFFRPWRRKIGLVTFGLVFWLLLGWGPHETCVENQFGLNSMIVVWEFRHWPIVIALSALSTWLLFAKSDKPKSALEPVSETAR